MGTLRLRNLPASNKKPRSEDRGFFTDVTTVSGGTLFDGGFAQARAVNASGVIVGFAQTSLGRRAWVYNPLGSGTVQDLNIALDPTTGGFDVLTDANAITDEGFVAGIGLVGAEEHGFASFQPVPAPPAAVSLLIGSRVGVAVTGGKRFLQRRRK